MSTKDFEVTKDLQLNSITHGKVSLEESVKYIVDYLSVDKKAKYEIAIGTDSMTRSQTKFALAIVVHRNTNGAIFFSRTFTHSKFNKNMLHEKLVRETSMSIDTAVFIAEELKKYGIDVLDNSSNIDFQVHMDIGTKGATAEFISELEGWVTAYSFKYKIKPESYASSTIADKLSK